MKSVFFSSAHLIHDMHEATPYASVCCLPVSPDGRWERVHSQFEPPNLKHLPPLQMLYALVTFLAFFWGSVQCGLVFGVRSPQSAGGQAEDNAGRVRSATHRIAKSDWPQRRVVSLHLAAPSQLAVSPWTVVMCCSD